MFRSQDHHQGATFFLAKVILKTLPEDDLRIETCWNDFKRFNVKFYVSALVGAIIKVIFKIHGSTIKIVITVFEPLSC